MHGVVLRVIGTVYSVMSEQTNPITSNAEWCLLRPNRTSSHIEVRRQDNSLDSWYLTRAVVIYGRLPGHTTNKGVAVTEMVDGIR